MSRKLVIADYVNVVTVTKNVLLPDKKVFLLKLRLVIF